MTDSHVIQAGYAASPVHGAGDSAAALVTRQDTTEPVTDNERSNAVDVPANPDGPYTVGLTLTAEEITYIEHSLSTQASLTRLPHRSVAEWVEHRVHMMLGGLIKESNDRQLSRIWSDAMTYVADRIRPPERYSGVAQNLDVGGEGAHGGPTGD